MATGHWPSNHCSQSMCATCLAIVGSYLTVYASVYYCLQLCPEEDHKKAAIMPVLIFMNRQALVEEMHQLEKRACPGPQCVLCR